MLLARTPENRISPTPRRIRALAGKLGNPQEAVPIVHVAGTNGKTSTARMIGDVLQAHGLRVGRYTSPHLTSLRERIVIDGHPVDSETFVELTWRVKPHLEQVDRMTDDPVSFFEAITALGFLAFAEANLDVAVVEVGIGGRWDATNIAPGRVAVINPISLDHTDLLGATEVAIAREKAGIIKPDATVVMGVQRDDVAGVIRRRARAVGADVVQIGTDVEVISRTPVHGGQLVRLRGAAGDYPDGLLPLFGQHQAQNAAVAVGAIEAFLAQTGRRVDPDCAMDALTRTSSPGRLDLIDHDPPVIVDASHNPSGLAATLTAIGEAFPGREVVVVLAVLADKDVDAILKSICGTAVQLVATANSSSRSLKATELAARAASVMAPGRVSSSFDLREAIQAGTRTAASSGAVVLVTGSVVTAGDALALLRARPNH